MDHLMEQLLQSSAVAVDKLAEAHSRQMQLSQQQRHAEENQDRILDVGQKVCIIACWDCYTCLTHWWTRVVGAPAQDKPPLVSQGFQLV